MVYNNQKKDYEERPVITSELLASFEKWRSLINTIEWNPFIAKLPPYDGYSFVTQPNWEVPVIEKPMIQYFKIKDEWFANLKKDAKKN